MVHGARRESLAGLWVDGMKSAIGGSSDPSLISRITKVRNCKLESSKLRGIPVPPSPGRMPGRPGRDGSQTHASPFRRHTSGRRSNVMPRLYHCPARLLHMDLTGEVTAGGRHLCSTFVHWGATSHMVESYTNMREQSMRPAKHPSTVLSLCPTHPYAQSASPAPSRRHLRPAGVTCAQSASPAPSRRSVLLGLARRPGIYPGISTRSLGVDEYAFVFDELIELDFHGHTPVAQSAAIRRNQTQSDAIRRNQTQSEPCTSRRPSPCAWPADPCARRVGRAAPWCSLSEGPSSGRALLGLDPSLHLLRR